MSRNILSNVFIFATGAAVGSVVTWKLVKEKYEQIALEEIRAVRDFYEADSDTKNDEEADDEEPDDLVEDQKKYSKIVEESNYYNFRPSPFDSDYSEFDEEDEDDEDDEDDDEEPDNVEEEDEIMKEPYVIPPDEFDENGYETVTLYHYADGVLAEAYSNEVVENPNEIVGDDYADHYGEYEPDSVYVRNDVLKTDFEILRDTQRFSEVR